ncbi:LuxR C-terminal-related transcriptional regulator [Paraburkholderia sp. GAS334]|uniref:LuxR C-terminal-related transcriptional regulator n=1 Tax=Paraburkholderia sp. GAS334 TaxID=3035131 RepID=UPI003D1BE76B
MPIVAVLTTIDSQTVADFTAAGVSGCVGKSESADALMDALRLALAGCRYLPQALHAFETSVDSPATQKTPVPDAAPQASPCTLTPRQVEVLALAVRGESNKAIARRLDIAEGTVKVHLYTVYKALKVCSRSQASIAAARLPEVGEAQIHHALDGQLSLPRLFASMTPIRFKAGEVLFHKHAQSDALYYVVRGTVSLQEIGIEVGPGTMLGEIGLFSPDHRRTCTARCQSDCELLSASAAHAMRLYYQDPEFATYLIHLITRRMGANNLRSKN